MLLPAMLLLASGAMSGPRDNPDGAPGPGMICRRIEITGSIMGGRRLCKTKDDWRKFDDGNHAKAESYNDPEKRGWHTDKGG